MMRREEGLERRFIKYLVHSMSSHYFILIRPLGLTSVPLTLSFNEKQLRYKIFLLLY